MNFFIQITNKLKDINIYRSDTGNKKKLLHD